MASPRVLLPLLLALLLLFVAARGSYDDEYDDGGGAEASAASPSPPRRRTTLEAVLRVTRQQLSSSMGSFLSLVRTPQHAVAVPSPPPNPFQR